MVKPLATSAIMLGKEYSGVGCILVWKPFPWLDAKTNLEPCQGICSPFLPYLLAHLLRSGTEKALCCRYRFVRIGLSQARI